MTTSAETIATLEPLTKRKAWKALHAHYNDVRRFHLRDLFVDDPQRGERLTVEAAGVFLDYSKNRITEETVQLLVQLAEESGLRQRIDAMFGGEKINVTENRAVLHVALRAPSGTSIIVDGENVLPQVHAVLDRMSDFSNRVRSAGNGRATPASVLPPITPPAGAQQTMPHRASGYKRWRDRSNPGSWRTSSSL